MTKVKVLVAAMSIIMTSYMYAQVSCVDGFAGIYPCSGYDLMSFLSPIELGNSGNGNDCWGWTHPETGQEIVLMGTGTRTVFVDISDPVNPVVLGFLPSGNSLHRDIKVNNNHAFIVCESLNHGMYVFDLMQLGDVVSPPVSYSAEVIFGTYSAHNIAINEESNFAYIVGDYDFFEGGPGFVDITDPNDPIVVGGYDSWGYTHDAQIVNYNGPDENYIEDEASDIATFSLPCSVILHV